MINRYLLLLACLAAGFPSPALAQKVGPEFQVNTYTRSQQLVPAVASDEAGNFVVVWQSRDQDGSERGVFGQRFTDAGNSLGAEFQVNTYTTEGQTNPSIASDAGGNFVVVWVSYGQDGSQWGIFGQRYDSGGTPLAGEFQVNTYTTEGQFSPSVASDANGNFIVVWQSLAQENETRTYGVFGQRYDSSGSPLGDEFLVNTYTTSNQEHPDVGCDANGNFVVVWESQSQDNDDGHFGVFGQRFDVDGHPLGGEFQVNTYTTSDQASAHVASDANGNFVVVWQSLNQNGDGIEAFGQRYDSSGNRLGGEFQVNTYTTGTQAPRSVASDANGNFVVVWSSDQQDGSRLGTFGRRYDSGGNPVGGEFQVNTYTTGDQGAASIAVDKIGNSVVVWDSQDQDGHKSGVFGQRFSGGCRSTAVMPTFLCPPATR